jgi:colicin import membrane protein
MAKKPAAAPAPEPETGTELATFAPDNPVMVFQSPDAVDKLIADIATLVNNFVPDLTTAKGRKEIASLAHKVVRTKTTLDNAGGELNAERRRLNDVVDEQRRDIRKRLDELRDKARKPLDDWEAAEEARQATIKTIMDGMAELPTLALGTDAAGIAVYIAGLEASILDPDVFQDWHPIAIAAKGKALTELNALLVRAKQAEADAAELAELRRKEAERVEREAEEQARRDEEAVRVEAERQAEEDAKAAKDAADAAAEAAETKRLADIAEAEKRAAEKAKRDADAEAQRKLDEANETARKIKEKADADAEAERVAAQRKLDEANETARKIKEKADADAEAERVAAQAKIDAANAENARLKREAEDAAEQRRKEADEQAARDKDKKHRGEVMKAAKEAIMEHSGIAEDAARKIVLAIVAGEIPNVTLRF